MDKKRSDVKKKLKSISPFAIVSGVLLFIQVLSILAVLFWGLYTSIKPYNEFVDEANVIFFPKNPTFDNFIYAYKSFIVYVYRQGRSAEVIHIWEMLFNSVFISLGGTLVATFCACMMAYVTAHFNLKLGKVIMFINLMVITLPVIGSLPSTIKVLNTLGIYRNMLAYVFILRFSYCGTAYLIFVAAFSAIPKDLSEAAMIDGAGNPAIFLRLMLPLVKNTFFTLVLIDTVANWNDYQTARIFLEYNPTLAYGLWYMLNAKPTAYGQRLTVRIAASFMVMAPIMLVYSMFCNKFLGDISLGAVKG